MAKDDAAMTPYQLTVVTPFGDNEKGTIITDPATVLAILASENEIYVRKTIKGGN